MVDGFDQSDYLFWILGKNKVSPFQLYCKMDGLEFPHGPNVYETILSE